MSGQRKEEALGWSDRKEGMDWIGSGENKEGGWLVDADNKESGGGVGMGWMGQGP